MVNLNRRKVVRITGASTQTTSANCHVPVIWDLAFDTWHLNLLPLLDLNQRPSDYQRVT
jgi:hypothetical protein